MYVKHLSKENIQALILFASTIASVGLGILSSVINTRYLSPEDYGDVRYVQNILYLASSVLMFGYFQSGSRLLALSGSLDFTRRLKGGLIYILVVSSILLIFVTLICYFLHQNKPRVAYLFLISIPICFFQLFSQYLGTTCQGDNQIGRLAISRILPNTLYVPIAYYVFSSFGATSSRLMLLQWGIGTIVSLCIIVSTKPILTHLDTALKEIKRENREYGIQLYWGSLVMVSTNYLAGLFIGTFHSDNSEVGFYTLALTVTSPLAMLPSIIGTTYFKKFASLPEIPMKVMRVTILFTIISCICFVLFVKYVIVFLYSEEYITVADYASWLAVGFTVHGIGDMINRYLGSHGQGVAIRNSSMFNGFFKLLGYIILVYFFGAYGAVTTTVICSVIYFISLSYYYCKFVNS